LQSPSREQIIDWLPLEKPKYLDGLKKIKYIWQQWNWCTIFFPTSNFHLCYYNRGVLFAKANIYTKVLEEQKKPNTTRTPYTAPYFLYSIKTIRLLLWSWFFVHVIFLVLPPSSPQMARIRFFLLNILQLCAFRAEIFVLCSGHLSGLFERATMDVNVFRRRCTFTDTIQRAYDGMENYHYLNVCVCLGKELFSLLYILERNV
jgi:hypothetical protein